MINVNGYKIEYVSKLNSEFSFSSSNKNIKIKAQYEGNNNMIDEAILAREYYTNKVNELKAKGEKVSPGKVKAEALNYAKAKMKEQLGDAGYTVSVQPEVAKTVQTVSKPVQKMSESQLRQEYDDLILAEEFDVVYENKYRVENQVQETPFGVIEEVESTFQELEEADDVFGGDLSVFDIDIDF